MKGEILHFDLWGTQNYTYYDAQLIFINRPFVCKHFTNDTKISPLLVSLLIQSNWYVTWIVGQIWIFLSLILYETNASNCGVQKSILKQSRLIWKLQSLSCFQITHILCNCIYYGFNYWLSFDEQELLSCLTKVSYSWLNLDQALYFNRVPLARGCSPTR